MKTLVLALLFSLLLVGVSFGKSRKYVAPLLSVAVSEQIISEAREITNKLYLNEGEYIKIKEALREKYSDTENAKAEYRENPEALTMVIAKINQRTEAVIIAQLNHRKPKNYTSFHL